MSNYPADIDTFREKENIPQHTYDADKKTTIFVEDFEALESAVIAIQETLGENPQGDFDAVGERLDAASYQRITVGDTEPSSPSVGDLWVDTA